MFEIALILIALCFALSNYICLVEKNESKRIFLLLFLFIQILYIYSSVIIVFANYTSYLTHKYFQLRVNDESLFFLSIYVFFSFVGFVMVRFFLSGAVIPKFYFSDYKPSVLLALKYFVVLMLFCIIFREELIDEFQFYISERDNSSIYNFFRLFIIGMAGILLVYYINNNLMSICFVIVLVIFSIILKEKDPLFFVLMFIVLKGIIRLPRLLGILYLYGVVVVVLYSSQLFSLLRGGHPLGKDLFLKVFANTGATSFDSFGPLMASLYIYSNDLKFSDTLNIYFSSLIPQFFFNLFDADRGLDLGQVFAREIISGWLPGMGIGMSPLSEFAIYGILPGAALYLISILLLTLYFKISMKYILTNDHLKVAFILSLFPYLSLLYLRGYSVLIFKVFPVVILLSALTFYFLGRKDIGKSFNTWR